MPVAEWQSIDDLHAKLIADGWSNIEIEKDDGCFEAEGMDPQGRQVEAYFNPKTFELKKLELED